MSHRALLLAFSACAAGAWSAPAIGTVEAGRAVYLAEGCINCHSQYVRPETADAGRWGPQRPLDELLGQTPPLFGNRRQGPDLENVANRRSRAWQRVHLLDPRAITPGSRMPSYAHLFAGDAGRGESLLDYLDSLGADSAAARWQVAQTWIPADIANPGGAAKAADDFREFCASCHGAAGRGDGPLAARLPVPPRNLIAAQWVYLAQTGGAAAERLSLARLIKFGLPGSTMAGHEYLSDEEVLGLADYVRNLRQSTGPATVPAS